MAGVGHEMSKGVKLALGIILLWFGGACLFVAFMSGKVDSLTTGTNKNTGKAEGPHDMSELVSRLAANVQTAEAVVPGTNPNGVQSV